MRGGAGAGVFIASIVLLAAACDPIQGSGAGAPPDPSQYIKVDDASHSAIVTLIAGHPATDNQFNYDGYSDGSLILTVPVGWQVTIQCENRGTVSNSCSVVTDADAKESSDPSTSSGELEPGHSAAFNFTPSSPGSYRIASLVDGHEASGMWLDLEVVSAGRPTLESPDG